MGSLLGNAQYNILLVLSVVGFIVEAFAFVDAIRHRPDAYTAAGKRTKTFWGAITGGAAVLGFLFLLTPGALNFISLIAVVAAGVYLADVRPALRQVTGRGGSNQGPYGPW